MNTIQDPITYYLARFIFEALLWNDWEDVRQGGNYLGSRFLTRKTRTLQVEPIHNFDDPPDGGVLNFRVLNRYQRIQAWYQAFLGFCHPEVDFKNSAIFESSIYASFLIVLSQIQSELDWINTITSDKRYKRRCSYYRKLALDAFKAVCSDYFEEYELANLGINLRDFRRLLLKSEGRTEGNDYFFQRGMSTDSDIQDKISELEWSNSIPPEERERLLKKYLDTAYTVHETNYRHWQILIEQLSVTYLQERDFELNEGTLLSVDPITGEKSDPDAFLRLCQQMQLNLDFFCISAHLSLCPSYEQSLVRVALLLSEVILSGGTKIPSLDELQQAAKGVKVKKSTTFLEILKYVLPCHQFKELDNIVLLSSYNSFKAIA